ncbi:hypothetical protein GCM10017687_80780 [Streptomyces echinatus]|uniref:hypothetical protein n=1 Tax=Streptomyces echinatus TaxID=67293 RepID=UPI0031E7945E
MRPSSSITAAGGAGQRGREPRRDAPGPPDQQYHRLRVEPERGGLGGAVPGGSRAGAAEWAEGRGHQVQAPALSGGRTQHDGGGLRGAQLGEDRVGDGRRAGAGDRQHPGEEVRYSRATLRISPSSPADRSAPAPSAARTASSRRGPHASAARSAGKASGSRGRSWPGSAPRYTDAGDGAVGRVEEMAGGPDHGLGTTLGEPRRDLGHDTTVTATTAVAVAATVGPGRRPRRRRRRAARTARPTGR